MARPRRQLVILQPSPFCNIDCRYCYLPHRNRRERMSSDTLHQIYEAVFTSQRLRDPITFLWHAGEPLAVGHRFYEEAFALAAEINQRHGRTYIHNIQTNATLIDEQWIDLFARHQVLLGVSVDGPAFLHDRQRVTRSGKGTHTQVMAGIRQLQEHAIDFEVITVLTDFALDYPDALFDFYVAHDIRSVGFNIDEIEGIHRSSTYQTDHAERRYRRFMHRFLERVNAQPERLRVREFRASLPVLLDPAVAMGDGEGFNNTNVPLQILTINYQGDYTTFCPELMGTPDSAYGDFIMGNVFELPIDEIESSSVFQQVNRAVQAGVQACKANCDYWALCGGGSPANKYFETGRLDTTETMHCRIHVKALAETIVTFYEGQLVDQPLRPSSVDC
ncbi:MAG TPA: GRRM system radical SAM/SPASM domain protein [Caldilineaceae bacterium]|nr:GRRM system radical SAM/SPASM domain protein [Caldilineaceae bacterium]